MGLFDLFKGKDDDEEGKRNKELDELEEIIFEDTEYDDWAEAGYIPDSNPGSGEDDEDRSPRPQRYERFQRGLRAAALCSDNVAGH